jgi:hypothetical protein
MKITQGDSDVYEEQSEEAGIRGNRNGCVRAKQL